MNFLYLCRQNKNEQTMKKILFIDRDGTIIREPEDEQIDAFEKLQFVPRAISNLVFLRQHTDYLFVMVSNQDGLGTPAFPEDTFWPVHNFILNTLKGEGVEFDDMLIDPHFPEDNAPTRKPNTGLVAKYMNNPDYDIANSYVIGDRDTDRRFAENIGCRFLKIDSATATPTDGAFSGSAAEGDSWDRAAAIAFGGERTAEVRRITKETDILVRLDLDGHGHCDIQTGLGFFDHMLEQIGKHGMMDLTIHCKGDLHVDEHHTIEDTALVLGECLLRALGDKRGIERYGYCLPMDDCLCSVCLDFGGRPWLVWDAEFHRERIGEMPTEMFLHFFKSLSDAARMNLNIRAEGQNEHHKIEGIFKALARSLRMAVRRDIYHYELPSTKGTL
jgi:imidazoleglycerol-phosphate dehydratase/histidinol-phosphatase